MLLQAEERLICLPSNELQVTADRLGGFVGKSKKKRKQKTVSQKVVNMGTSGIIMPKVARDFLGHRIIASLIMLAVPLLLFSGVVSVDFRNGRPHFSFNKDKAAQVEQRARARLEDFREDQSPSLATNTTEAVKSFVGQQKSNLGFQDKDPSGVTETIGKHINTIRQADATNVIPGVMPDLNAFKPAEPDEPSSPFSKLKKRFDRLR